MKLSGKGKGKQNHSHRKRSVDRSKEGYLDIGLGSIPTPGAGSLGKGLVGGGLELEAFIDNLLSNPEILEARKTAAKQAFRYLSSGVIENVWTLLDYHILKNASCGRMLTKALIIAHNQSGMNFAWNFCLDMRISASLLSRVAGNQ
uniref:Probable 3-deoxy-D-manno-octulosonic acid transferase, mitochondrial isoform X1 n=1 Tax=Tanacetum cinerariifolium TaxID=118510 RepID=A0A6L2NDK1_TANCI|nr:probable 3-deoxy-D-manno-octulosonic acid transferase, mitochondrial isoform X1 [Tanacetum cinerariifolium]